ncbi:adenylosuccinate lyase [Candidatus Daviesbacteria bacterium]|nr:adenylosuccinate lyase [Candidatus Daviesbacteria bacterium]
MSKIDYSNYQSVFSWRYGSPEMREIFSEANKYRLWRRIWVEMARLQSKQGLVKSEELEDLESNQENINIERILEIEKETGHDVVAAIREFAEVAKVGGGKIHLGATSMDIVDNADSIRAKEALVIIEDKLIKLLKNFSEKIEKYADLPCMAYTHLHPAEPTTLGYRFALYGQDLLWDLNKIKWLMEEGIKSKGFKGAVGTQASYQKLMGEKVVDFENELMEKLGLKTVLISGQTTPRKIDYLISTVLSSIAQSLNKFAFDLRILQSPNFGEVSEPFGKTQVGSSSMPFKKNPVKSEQICSLARLVINLSKTADENAANSLLERTLDDSANRRVYMPEMFLCIDEILNSATKIISGLVVNEAKIQENLERYAPFAATEEVIIEAVKRGANRQEMHEILREISMEAWSLVSVGEENPMLDLLMKREEVLKYVGKEKLEKIIDPENHLGTAPVRAKKLVNEIKKAISS